MALSTLCRRQLCCTFESAMGNRFSTSAHSKEEYDFAVILFFQPMLPSAEKY